MRHKSSWLTPLTIFACVVIMAAALGLLPPIRYPTEAWAGWREDGCRSFNCYCEAFRDSLVLQTISSYSSLSFVLVGLLILWAPFVPGESLIETRPVYRRVFGAAAILIGFGSFFYHATLTLVGEWFDLMGMYLFAGFLLLYNLARLRPLSGPAFALAYVAVMIVGGVQMIVARELQQGVFGGLLAGALVIEVAVQALRRRRSQKRYLFAAVACFVLGAVMWTLDRALPCRPDSLWQWHGAWHVLTAASAGLMYSYYRSER